MGIAERLAVVSRHHHERLVVQAARAQPREEPAQLVVDARHRVQVAAEVVVVGRPRPVAEEVDRFVSGNAVVRVVGLLGPDGRVERARGVAVDPLERAVDEHRVAAAPGVDGLPRVELLEPAHLVVTARPQEGVLVDVLDETRGEEGGAVPLRLQDVGGGAAGEVRVLLRVLAPGHVRVHRERERDESVRGEADVRVGAVGHAAPALYRAANNRCSPSVVA